MIGGSNPNFALGGKVFASTTSNALSLALPVIYSTGVLAIGGLTNQTTYYAIPLTSYSFELAKYSTSAVVDAGGGASVDVVIVTSTNSHVAPANTYTLAETGIVGNSTWTWQSSNDGVNWTTSIATGAINVNLSSYTNPPTSSLIDFGFYNFRYLRLNITAPTQGALYMNAVLNIKQDGIGRY
jgi:hypothetical protein